MDLRGIFSSALLVAFILGLFSDVTGMFISAIIIIIIVHILLFIPILKLRLKCYIVDTIGFFSFIFIKYLI